GVTGEGEPGRVALPDLHAARQSLARDPGTGRLQHLRALVEPDDASFGPDLVPELARKKRRPTSDVEAPLAPPRAQRRARARALGRDRGRRIHGLEPRHLARAEPGGHPAPPGECGSSPRLVVSFPAREPPGRPQPHRTSINLSQETARPVQAVLTKGCSTLGSWLP